MKVFNLTSVGFELLPRTEAFLLVSDVITDLLNIKKEKQTHTKTLRGNKIILLKNMPNIFESTKLAKLLVCDVCKKKLCAKSNLNRYYRSKHERLRFECNQCE